MIVKNIWEWDKRNFERLKKFQLHHRFKKIGALLFIILLLALIALKFIESEPALLKSIIKNGLLVGLLMISVSKEKIEDERIVHLRQQSYQIAFVLGVVYSIALLPLVNYVVDIILQKEVLDFSTSTWEVLFFMLVMQIYFFRMMLKKCQ